MAEVALRQVAKVYDGAVRAVRDVNITVHDKEFMVLVGPSGSGKSTVLRMVAGLESISEGDISIDGRVVNSLPPKKRDIAMVFQDYALYPHMNVFDNMAFGLKVQKYPMAEIRRRVDEAASILELTELLERKPRALSGGQRQRVAVGRAIVRKPKVFLFDEPLSNLDAKLRTQMRTEIKKIHARLGATIIYVTHDQIEAMTMGDRITVMDHGLVQQIDTPLNLYLKPVNRFVAGFLGSPPMNFVPCRLADEGGALYLDEGSGKLRVPPKWADILRTAGLSGGTVVLGVRPESIGDKLYIQPKYPDCVLTAVVDVVEPMGAEVYCLLKTAKNSIQARFGGASRVQPNQEIDIVFDLDAIHFFHPETGVSLA